MQLLNAPADSSRPIVAVDLEGTLTAGETWKGMLAYLAEQDNPGAIRRFYYRKMLKLIFRRATGTAMRQLKNDWMRDLLRLFAGYPMPRFTEMTAQVVENELWPRRRQALIRELEDHLEHGRRVLVVSGMYETLLETLLERLPGFEAVGTGMKIDKGIFSGELSEPFNIAARKAENLSPFLQDGKIYAGYGDTASDEAMLSLSSHPTAVHPRKQLRKIAATRNWRIFDD